MNSTQGMTDGNFGAMWLWVQTGDRIAGLMTFADIIIRWHTGKAERIERSAEQTFDENPLAAMLVDPDGEDQSAALFTERTMTASLLTAANACVENLAIGVCSFVNISLKAKAHWEDAAKGLKKKGIELELLRGYWAVKRIRLLTNAFKHNDGSVNAELHELLGWTEGEEIPYEQEDCRMLLAAVDDFLAAFRDAVSTIA